MNSSQNFCWNIGPFYWAYDDLEYVVKISRTWCFSQFFKKLYNNKLIYNLYLKWRVKENVRISVMVIPLW